MEATSDSLHDLMYVEIDEIIWTTCKSAVEGKAMTQLDSGLIDYIDDMMRITVLYSLEAAITRHGMIATGVIP